MKTKVIFILAATLLLCGSATAQTMQMRSKIKETVEQKYKGALIKEIDMEDNGLYEVEILHEKLDKDLLFDKDGVWMQTKYDIRERDLPKNIEQALNSSGHKFNYIDDIDLFETPEGSHYEIEVGRWFSGDEFTVYIDTDGNIL